MHDRVDLIDVAVHASLADHMASDALRLGRRGLEQGAELLERYVVVQLARGQQVVLEHCAVQDRGAVVC